MHIYYVLWIYGETWAPWENACIKRSECQCWLELQPVGTVAMSSTLEAHFCFAASRIRNRIEWIFMVQQVWKFGSPNTEKERKKLNRIRHKHWPLIIKSDSCHSCGPHPISHFAELRKLIASGTNFLNTFLVARETLWRFPYFKS